MTLVSWEKGLVIAGSVGGLLAVLYPAVFWFEVRRLEKPAYSLVRKLGEQHKWGWLRGEHGAELRRYAPYLIAEVSVQEAKDMRHALNQGFRKVASFIFGNNTSVDNPSTKESVAMTSPVRLEMQGPGSQVKGAGSSIAQVTRVPGGGDMAYRVSFVMPSKYSLSTLPKPKDSAVVIREVPGCTMAVLGFGGNLPTEQTVAQREAQLRSILQAEGLQAEEGKPLHVWQYHPPFAPGFVRVNEVLLQVKEP